MESANRVDFVSVVVPVYNESGCLDELLSRTLAVLDEIGRRFEFILVDDGSSDDSAEKIVRAAEARPDQVVAVILNRNYGQHNAIMAGFSLVRGDLVVTMDADLQNPPEEIPNLIAAAEKGNDVVGTIRQNRRDTFFRRYASKVVNCAARAATGVMMNDYGCMLRAYRRGVVDAMLQCHERSTFIPVLGNGFARRTTEIPVAHAARTVGDSKYSLWKLINLQFNLLTCMTTLPLRILTYFGLGAGLFGFLLSLYIIVRRLCPGGDTWGNAGVFTLFAVTFILVGIQMIGIGVIGEYIGRIYTDVRARPRFFIEKIVGRKNA
ncbi:MAG: glycosyltransferase [Victivallaceae bacterium]|nr:glycosyltransferase [Victivallaceae bacterium]